MPQLDARRTYQDGMVLFAADLDAIIDDIETLLNVTKLNDDNIQDNGITASQKLIDGTVTTGKLANKSVTTVKIDDDAVTEPKLANDAVTTAKIADEAVTTEKIADSAVTPAKLSVIPKLKIQEFTSNGTWTCPQGVNVVLLIGCGGGGGGCSGIYAPGEISFILNGAGGAGAPLGIRVVSVTPGQSYNVTIGAGGAPGPRSIFEKGGDGGNTTFGNLVTFRGGGGGQMHSPTSPSSIHEYRGIPPGGGTYGGGAAFGNFHEAQSSFGYAGGSGNGQGSTGGGGGAGPFGPGGNGANQNAPAQSAPHNSGAGGGGGYAAPGREAAGAGGSGRLIIVWLESQ